MKQFLRVTPLLLVLLFPILSGCASRAMETSAPPTPPQVIENEVMACEMNLNSRRAFMRCLDQQELTYAQAAAVQRWVVAYDRWAQVEEARTRNLRRMSGGYRSDCYGGIVCVNVRSQYPRNVTQGRHNKRLYGEESWGYTRRTWSWSLD